MNLFWLKIKRLVFTLFLGIPATIWLLMRDSHTIYYIPHIGLGEYSIELGYLGSFKKRHSIEHITVIVPPNRVEVAKYYPYWESLLVLKDPLYLSLACLGSMPIGRSIHRRIKRIISVSFTMHVNKKLLYDNPGITPDGLAKMILKIPYSEERKAPCVPEINIDHIITAYGLPYGNTVLLNPYTGGGAVQEIPNEFYEKMTLKLKQTGFTVATLLANKSQKAITGTQGIVSSLAEAWHLARWCGWLIGTRSGFFDFVQMSGCNIVAIYDGVYKLREFFSLRPLGKKEHVIEFVWKNEHEDKIIDNILSECMGWKAETT